MLVWIGHFHTTRQIEAVSHVGFSGYFQFSMCRLEIPVIVAGENCRWWSQIFGLITRRRARLLAGPFFAILCALLVPGAALVGVVSAKIPITLDVFHE